MDLASLPLSPHSNDGCQESFSSSVWFDHLQLPRINRARSQEVSPVQPFHSPKTGFCDALSDPRFLLAMKFANVSNCSSVIKLLHQVLRHLSALNTSTTQESRSPVVNESSYRGLWIMQDLLRSLSFSTLNLSNNWKDHIVRRQLPPWRNAIVTPSHDTYILTKAHIKYGC